MTSIRLSDADFAAFRDMLDSPPSPLARLRRLMREPVRMWSETVSEPVPDEFLKLLAELPSFSDGSSGAGGITEAGPTSLGSDIRHCGDGSLSIPEALDGEPLASHGLAHRQGCTAAPPTKLTTPASDGGSA